MKTMALLSVLTFCLLSAGCGGGPVEEVKAFIDAKDDVILQISKKLEANPTAAGVDEARKVFEARKEDLRARREEVDKKVGGRHGDLITMLAESTANDAKMFDAIRGKLAVACQGSECSPAREKFSALEKDFNAAVKQ